MGHRHMIYCHNLVADKRKGNDSLYMRYLPTENERQHASIRVYANWNYFSEAKVLKGGFETKTQPMF